MHISVNVCDTYMNSFVSQPQTSTPNAVYRASGAAVEAGDGEQGATEQGAEAESEALPKEGATTTT